MAANLDPRFHSQRANIFCERFSGQPDLSPSWPRWRAARETDFIRSVRGQIATPICRRERNPLDVLNRAVRFNFDLGLFGSRNAPDIIRRRLAVLQRQPR